MTEGNFYIDEEGVIHVRAACGHFITDGLQDPNSKHLLCPNCRFLSRFQNIEITNPEQMPEEYKVNETR